MLYQEKKIHTYSQWKKTKKNCSYTLTIKTIRVHTRFTRLNCWGEKCILKLAVEFLIRPIRSLDFIVWLDETKMKLLFFFIRHMLDKEKAMHIASNEVEAPWYVGGVVFPIILYFDHFDIIDELECFNFFATVLIIWTILTLVVRLMQKGQKENFYFLHCCRVGLVFLFKFNAFIWGTYGPSTFFCVQKLFQNTYFRSYL